MGWIVGYALLPAYAYWLQDYKKMQLGVMATLLLLFVWFYFVDESVRWQIVTGKIDKAEVTLKRALKMNGRSDENLKEDLNDLSDYLKKVSPFSSPSLLTMCSNSVQE